jgi:hypothetical protein
VLERLELGIIEIAFTYLMILKNVFRNRFYLLIYNMYYKMKIVNEKTGNYESYIETDDQYDN